MYVLLLVLVIILILIAGFLLVPFHLSLQLNMDGPVIRGSYKFAWLGVNLRKETVPLPELKETMVERKKRKAEQEKEARFERWRAVEPKVFMNALPAIGHILKDWIGSAHLDQFSCSISLGLQDPADTAAICGYLWSFLSAIGLNMGDLLIEPYFGGDRLNGSLKADLKAKFFGVAVALFRAFKDKRIRMLIKDIARSDGS